MSDEKISILNEIKAKGRLIERKLNDTKMNAAVCNSYLVNYQKELKQLAREYALRVEDVNQKIARIVENSEEAHELIGKLIQQKNENLQELKAAIHSGKEKCEYCSRFYTASGLTRHQPTCAMKPAVKQVKKKETEIEENKEDLAKRKEELKAELKKLEGG